MKLLFGLLVGVVLGAVCAGALVYFNPLIVAGQPPGEPKSQAMRYSLSGPHLLASTHNELLPLPVEPDGTPRVWESGVRGSWLQVLALENATGVPGGVATRLSVPSTRSNGLTAGLLTDDQWLITVPGRGTLYAYGGSNVWPVLKDTVLQVDVLGREWAGPRRYSLLRSPAGRVAEVTGLTGDFAGVVGTLAEVLKIGDYPGTGLAGLEAEVELELSAPEATAAELAGSR